MIPKPINSSRILKLIFIISFLMIVRSANASNPLVQFTQKPASTQKIAPNQDNLVFYTLKNNTPITFPLSIGTSSPFLTLANIGNTCGTKILANSSCVLSFQFTAPSSSQTIPTTISINYQGRAPLVDTITYVVDANIPCRLLPLEAYQTRFCQTQYQNVLTFTPNVFNVSGINVVDEQTLGGMFGIYQHSGNSDNVCYVSCGLSQLSGPAPDENMVFELASVTKTFTASILGMKVYQTTVDPLDSITPYLPPDSWGGPPYNLNFNEAPVTFQQLATFSGGVCFSDAPDVVLTDPPAQKQSEFVTDINLLDPTSATCLGSGANTTSVYGAPAYLPTHNLYSNSSVGLLGQVLMSLDGYSQMYQADFNGWMCQNVLTPLNMTMTNACLPDEAHTNTCTQTGTYCNTTSWSSAQYASGYHINNHTYQLGDPFPYVPWAAAGNLRSNTVDMIKFLQANLGINNNPSPSTIDLVQGMGIAHDSNNYLPSPLITPTPNIGSQSPLIGGQGYAWVCMPSFPSANAICGKIGGHENFRSFIGFSPSKQYGVIILFNTGSPSEKGHGAPSGSGVPTIGDIGVNLINQ